MSHPFSALRNSLSAGVSQYGIVAVALLSLGAIVPSAASAQDQATAQQASDESDDNAIVVTAQKRSENVQDVPKAVQVVGSAQLEQSGVTNLQDLGRVSPAIQGAVATPTSPPAIRGIASFALSIGVQTKTGIVIDDVPQPSFSTLANELTDIERVEVLPGPQSTLSGRNAAAGLINIVTHSPTREFTGKLTAEQTDDAQTRVGGYFSGPLSDTLGFSISGYYDRWAGPLRNVADNNRRLGGFNQRGVRGKLRWSPTDDLSFTLTGYYTKASFRTAGLIGGNAYVYAEPGAGSVLVPGSTLASLHPGAEVRPYSTTVSSPRNGLTQNINKGVSLRADYDMSLGTLSSISTYNRSTQPRSDLFVGYTFLGQRVTAETDVDTKYLTQEVRLASPGGAGAFQYLLGAIYSDTDNFQPYSRAPVFPVDWDRSASTKSFAAYGRLTYEILPGTSVTGGLRYQHDRTSYDWVFADGTAPRSHGSSGYGFVSGEASVQQEIAPDVMGYVTYANAQTGEAYDLEDSGSAMTARGLRPVASEKVQNYEAGFKTQWLDRRLTINLSVFRANYRSYQVQSLQQSNGDINEVPTIRLFAIGRVRTQGAELSSSLAVTRNLRLGLDASYLDAKILDYPGAQCFIGQTAAQGCLDGLQNRRGRLPNTSKLKATTSIRYTLPLEAAPFDANFGAFLRYQSKTQFDLFGDPYARQGSFAILNLTAGINSHSGRWTADLFVNNVTNRHHYALLQRDGFSPVPTLTGLYARDSSRYFGGRVGFSF
ncbi:TonB-dependent receptor [Novosphingobium sp. 11B]